MTPHYFNPNVFNMLNSAASPIPILKTERLTLRQLSITDSKEIFALRSDKAVNKYLDRQLSNGIEDASKFIKTIVESNALYWAITLQQQNILLGTICLFEFSDDNDTCEIGYELLPQFQGKGILHEAGKAVIAYAFNRINVLRILAHIHPDNKKSLKSLERLSFCKSNETDKTNPALLSFELKNSGSNCQ